MRTVSCDELRRFIDPYLDGEFDEREQAVFDAHIDQCEDCCRYVEQRTWLQRAIKPALQRPCSMSPLARERLETSLRRARRPQQIRNAIRKASKPLPALAVVGAIAMFVTPLTGFGPSVMEDVVDQHVQRAPVEVPTPMAKEASHWFADKLPFKMKTPTFKDRRVSLLGGRLSRIQRGPSKASIPAAHLIYSVGAHKLSVLVFDGEGISEMQPTQEIQNLGQPFEVHEVRDHRVAFYRRGGLTYAVTSKLPRKQLVELLGNSL